MPKPKAKLLFYVPGLAPALLSAIKELLSPDFWTLYLVLVYEVLAEGTNQKQYAQALCYFCPRHRDIVLFHNDLAKLTHSKMWAKAKGDAYAKLPRGQAPTKVPDVVREGYKALRERFVEYSQPREREAEAAVEGGADEDANMEEADEHQDDEEMDKELDEFGLTPGNFTIIGMEPSVILARCEAMEYLEGLNPFGAKSQECMDKLAESIAEFGLG
ncbi:hypothetical protein BU26DRAFT_569779 [Trematosphaeria pertusa]|uniref:Uncharacterized protein n=1 Tax=Trematosphaeria pertusa TaxID=390896 RepID=A0A6A6I067_9PLEO|nr:uncharacterized protein BU26DRAFT_569779 [Trematosphaeria pertusa]KAF2243884.1 hypothetical protein BU26DRAFT_569779 [Trematosphaeria pertusa]